MSHTSYHRWCIALSLWLVAPAGAQSTPPAPPDCHRNELVTLIAALGDDVFSRRESAQRELIETGPAIVPELRAALAKSRDEEQRSRLEVILKRIAEDAVIGATRITLSGRNLPALDAFDSVAAQAGIRVQLLPIDLWRADAAPPVDIEARRSPLWLVVRQLCEQLALEPSVVDDGLRLVPSTGCGLTRGPATVAGPLLISASRISHLRAIDLSQGGTRSDEFTITFNVLAEPKLRVMPGPTSVLLSEAVDDAGNSLLARDTPEVSYNSGGAVWSFATRLRHPAQSPGKRIARMTGTITLPVATRFAVLEVTDLGAPGPHVALASMGGEPEGLRFAVRHITQNGDRWEVALAASAPRGRHDEFNRVQQLLYSPDVRLLDASGRSILRSSGPNFTSSDQPNTLHMTLMFDRNLSDGRPTAGAPQTLVWRIPVETRQLTLPFEIRDLPMP